MPEIQAPGANQPQHRRPRCLLCTVKQLSRNTLMIDWGLLDVKSGLAAGFCSALTVVDGQIRLELAAPSQRYPGNSAKEVASYIACEENYRDVILWTGCHEHVSPSKRDETRLRLSNECQFSPQPSFLETIKTNLREPITLFDEQIVEY